MAQYEYIYEAVENIDLPLMARVAPGKVLTESDIGSELPRLEYEGLIRLIGFAKRGFAQAHA